MTAPLTPERLAEAWKQRCLAAEAERDQEQDRRVLAEAERDRLRAQAARLKAWAERTRDEASARSRQEPFDFRWEQGRASTAGDILAALASGEQVQS